MRQTLTIIFLFTLVQTCFSQVPEDALKFSWYPQNGTARNQAIGAVMGSLGGDLTATFVNPAGLGFYKTREAVITGSLFQNKTDANYRQASTLVNNKSVAFGPSGLIVGFPSQINPRKSHAVSFAINQVASFNNEIRYKAYNNYSSFSEQFAEALVNTNAPVQDFLYTNSSAPYTIATPWQAYLIDTATIDGVQYVRGASENILDAGEAVQQEMIKKTRGGIYELAFAFAENDNKHWLWGITAGVPIVYSKSNSTFIERDSSSNRFNGFDQFTYNDEFTTSGVGINLKLGAIYRPAEYVRLGLAFHTPSFLLLTDKRVVNIETALEDSLGNLQALNKASSLEFTNDKAGQPSYYQTTPWKVIVSAPYVFREVQDVSRQRGFISADIEYVNHRATRFSSNNEVPAPGEKEYFKGLNKLITQEYKSTFNFKLGGELKFNTLMGRLGLAYYGNPYKEKMLKAKNLLLSGGLGYRDNGFFIDLTYVHQVRNDVSFPYRLEDRANTFASLKNQQGNIIASFGFKF